MSEDGVGTLQTREWAWFGSKLMSFWCAVGSHKERCCHMLAFVADVVLSRSSHVKAHDSYEAPHDAQEPATNCLLV